MIRLVGEEWQLGNKVRGQSHDVFALELFEGNLVSGGITTDFCFYPLQNGEFTGEYFHKVSYCGVQRVSSEGRLVLVNQRSSFEIWSIANSLYRTELLVRYKMPAEKFIVSAKLFKQ
jgi:hypothetical protein